MLGRPSGWVDPMGMSGSWLDRPMGSSALGMVNHGWRWLGFMVNHDAVQRFGLFVIFVGMVVSRG